MDGINYTYDFLNKPTFFFPLAFPDDGTGFNLFDLDDLEIEGGGTLSQEVKDILGEIFKGEEGDTKTKANKKDFIRRYAKFDPRLLAKG